jgi:hypothetical protein
MSHSASSAAFSRWTSRRAEQRLPRRCEDGVTRTLHQIDARRERHLVEDRLRVAARRRTVPARSRAVHACGGFLAIACTITPAEPRQIDQLLHRGRLRKAKCELPDEHVRRRHVAAVSVEQRLPVGGAEQHVFGLAIDAGIVRQRQLEQHAVLRRLRERAVDARHAPRASAPADGHPRARGDVPDEKREAGAGDDAPPAARTGRQRREPEADETGEPNATTETKRIG